MFSTAKTRSVGMCFRNDSLENYDPSSLLYPKYSQTTHVYLFILNSPFLFLCLLTCLHDKNLCRKNRAWKSCMFTSRFYYDFDNTHIPNSDNTPLPITYSLMNSGLVASGALLFAIVNTANHHTTIPSRWPHLLPRPN